MKKHLSTISLILVFITGLSLLLYPTVSDYWNSLHQSRAIATYTENVAQIDDEAYKQIWEDAINYNAALLEDEERFIFSEEEYEEYKTLINVSESGTMGYIEIPVIDCSLPIYHGTDEVILQIGVGHIAGSSLPVGGESTHCVLSGHRGLPSAKLFTDLDKLKEGDSFVLRILDETLTYEIDKIWIVEPTEIDNLEIEEGKDYCTLVTCTPYGVNSHRLLVRGYRTENQISESMVRIAADALQIEPVIVAPILAIPLLLGLLIWLLIKYRKR